MLLLECLPDETLARHVGFTRRQFDHGNDKGGVCNRLKRAEGWVAMIDEDPGAAQPRYLQNLRSLSEQHGIRILQDDQRNHRVVVIQPRLEEWLIATASAAKLSLADFGLSARGNDLHKEINFRLPNLIRLLERLAEMGSPRLAHLRNALRP